MEKNLSYVNTSRKPKAGNQPSSREAELYSQIRKLEAEIKSLRKTGIGTTENIRVLDEKVEPGNVVII